MTNEDIRRIAKYYVNYRATIRVAARVFGFSKSAIHYNLNKVLPKIDESLYKQYKEVANININQAHTHGGQVTKLKYSKKGKTHHDNK